ncbi:hypothetical protein RN001_013336 [Aquatica leii]|uniref:H/ACA ribonucleoprotein complex non-core subunit NAF1 n=1 Tax=Aquatica leii TaxID=1421715 RepID=A0AAN7S6Y6_9COLE|nr:hypothetical protein RN001_013336 [Aquatica leii]
MDNSTGIEIQEGASKDVSLNPHDAATHNFDKNKKICGQVETIIVPAVQSPNPAESKTDATTETLVESIRENTSNKDEELCDNVQQLNIYEQNQGQANTEENQGNKNIPSVQKINISESLSNLLAYGSTSEDSEADSANSLSESDSDTDDDISNNAEPPLNEIIETKDINIPVEKYRESNANLSTETSDNEDSSDAESDLGAKSETLPQTVKVQAATDGELGLDDLPPVPDLSNLSITLKEGECIQMGNVTSIVDRLVMIQSLPNVPAYDLDTLLFLDEGKRPLGHVYDVMGQVTSPMYVVRFNSKQEIESKGIAKGLPIYSAPNTEHTQYVFLKELMKIKGSDASWRGDNEVPVEFVDFSDDEAEYSFSKQNLNEQDIFDKKRKRNSIEKHKMFETAMNLKNKVDTARHKMRDSYEPTPKRYMPHNSQPAFYYHHPPNVTQVRQQCSTSFTSFPPPNFPMPPPAFGFMGMGPTMLGMPPFNAQFGRGIPPFPPNPQPFPPPTFGPPTIPPLPAVPHVLSQPPPVTFPGNLAVMAPNVAVMNMPKHNIPKTSKSPKTNQNGGVVPKAQPNLPKPRNIGGLPKVYMPSPSEYQPPYPPNLGLPKVTLPPFTTNAPQNMPSIPPPFCPPMPPWPFNMARPPHNSLGFQPHYSGGRPFQKQ